MSSLPVTIHEAESDTPGHRESIRAVMLRMSRNLLRYQQIEHELKLFLPNALQHKSGVALTGAALNKRKRAIASGTLGTLLQLLSEALAAQPDTEGQLLSSVETAENERRVKEDRDHLVHHLGQSWFHDLSICRSVSDELDAAFIRAEELSHRVQTLLFGQLVAPDIVPSKHDVQSRPSPKSDASIDLPTLHLVTDQVPGTDQQAEVALHRICSTEWIPLSRIGQRIYDEVPAARDVMKRAGGLQAWVASKCTFEIRITTRAEVRRRPKAAAHRN